MKPIYVAMPSSMRSLRSPVGSLYRALLLLTLLSLVASMPTNSGSDEDEPVTMAAPSNAWPKSDYDVGVFKDAADSRIPNPIYGGPFWTRLKMQIIRKLQRVGPNLWNAIVDEGVSATFANALHVTISPVHKMGPKLPGPNLAMPEVDARHRAWLIIESMLPVGSYWHMLFLAISAAVPLLTWMKSLDDIYTPRTRGKMIAAQTAYQMVRWKAGQMLSMFDMHFMTKQDEHARQNSFEVSAEDHWDQYVIAISDYTPGSSADGHTCFRHVFRDIDQLIAQAGGGTNVTWALVAQFKGLLMIEEELLRRTGQLPPVDAFSGSHGHSSPPRSASVFSSHAPVPFGQVEAAGAFSPPDHFSSVSGDNGIFFPSSPDVPAETVMTASQWRASAEAKASADATAAAATRARKRNNTSNRNDSNRSTNSNNSNSSTAPTAKFAPRANQEFTKAQTTSMGLYSGNGRPRPGQISSDKAFKYTDAEWRTLSSEVKDDLRGCRRRIPREDGTHGTCGSREHATDNCDKVASVSWTVAYLGQNHPTLPESPYDTVVAWEKSVAARKLVADVNSCVTVACVVFAVGGLLSFLLAPFFQAGAHSALIPTVVDTVSNAYVSYGHTENKPSFSSSYGHTKNTSWFVLLLIGLMAALAVFLGYLYWSKVQRKLHRDNIFRTVLDMHSSKSLRSSLRDGYAVHPHDAHFTLESAIRCVDDPASVVLREIAAMLEEKLLTRVRQELPGDIIRFAYTPAYLATSESSAIVQEFFSGLAGSRFPHQLKRLARYSGVRSAESSPPCTPSPPSTPPCVPSDPLGQ